MTNLADNSAYASMLHKLYGHLTSLVDPDTIAEAALRKQHQVLTEMVQKKAPGVFSRTLIGRLGRGQASLLTRKYHRSWRHNPDNE